MFIHKWNEPYMPLLPDCIALLPFGWYSFHPAEGRKLELAQVVWLYIEVTYLLSTNRAWHKVTSLMHQTTSPLSYAATHTMHNK